MGKDTSPGVKPLTSGGAYIVVAALNGKDDKPDLSTLRAFMATAAQGVSYDQGTWRESYHIESKRTAAEAQQIIH